MLKVVSKLKFLTDICSKCLYLVFIIFFLGLGSIIYMENLFNLPVTTSNIFVCFWLYAQHLNATLRYSRTCNCVNVEQFLTQVAIQ